MKPSAKAKIAKFKAGNLKAGAPVGKKANPFAKKAVPAKAPAFASPAAKKLGDKPF